MKYIAKLEIITTDKESFYSELKEQGITDEDYVHAQIVWDV